MKNHAQVRECLINDQHFLICRRKDPIITN